MKEDIELQINRFYCLWLNEKMSLYKKSIRTIEGLLSDEFQRNLLNACFQNLEEESNPLCFNNFAYSMRELAIHILDDLAPNDEVKECSWYDEKKSHKGKPSRKQKVKYAIQGVLSDVFVDKKIMCLKEIDDTTNKIASSFSILNKYTHVTEKTFDISKKEKDEKAKEVIDSFVSLYALIQEYKNKIIYNVEHFITDDIYEQAIYETLGAIDELATHHSIESVYVNDISIEKIKEDLIVMDVTGDIDVILQWGSNGDLRRGDGHERETSFSFDCIVSVEISESDYSDIKVGVIRVDTDEYFGETDGSFDKMIKKDIERATKGEIDEWRDCCYY